MPVTGDDLRRHRGHLETQPAEGVLLDPRIDRGMGAHGPRQLPNPDILAGRDQTASLPFQLVEPAGEHEAEADRLGVDPVGTSRHEGAPLLDGAAAHHFDQAVEVLEQKVGGLHQLHRQRGIEHV